jgi:hypothetical protein
MKTTFANLLAIIIVSSCTATIYSSKDPNIDFSKYKSFAWYAKVYPPTERADFNNELIESNIKNYGSSELKLRGLKVDVDSADVIFDFTVMIKHKEMQEQNPVYSHPYNYNAFNPTTQKNYNSPARQMPYISSYATTNVPYDEGTLTIMMIDRRTNRLIWKGWAVGTVTDEQTYEAELQSDIHQMFKKFPTPIKKKK